MLLADRWYQEEATDSLFDFFENHAGRRDAKGRPIAANPLICLPTGTGKSVVIARFLQRAFSLYPQTRCMMLTHVKELIDQNAIRLQEAWPVAPLGIYSAGLKSRDQVQPIIFGGIKSVVGKEEMFGHRDFLVIDEAHLIPGDGDSAQYLKCIAKMQEINPFLKVIGLTATPYRLGLGLMTNGKIFTDIAYDLCNIEGFNRLIAEGFLCPVIPPSRMPNGEPIVQMDLSKVGKSGGEFNAAQMEEAADRITVKMLQQVVELAANRHSWLIFASGVKHAEHIAMLLNTAFGIPTGVVHSKRSQAENDEALRAWKAGELRAIVNMNSLTTGVDHPACDFIAVARATMSTGLWVQMLGRGTRPWDYTLTRDPILARMFPYRKSNCLVADFGGNAKRLGPINDPVIPRMRGQGAPGDAPIKVCPRCGVYNNASAAACIACGHEFPYGVNFGTKASTEELIRSDLPQVESFKVDVVILNPHKSQKGNSSIKVAYHCGLRSFYEYINIEAHGWHGKKSRDWFRQRYGEPWDGITNAQILANTKQLRHPSRIRVWINKELPEIVEHEF